MTSTFSIRLDKKLLEAIKEIADRETRTTNQQIVYLIEKGLSRYEIEQEAIASIDSTNQSNRKKDVG